MRAELQLEKLIKLLLGDFARAKTKCENPEWKLKEEKQGSLHGAETPFLRFSKSSALDCLRKTLSLCCWLAHGCTALWSPAHLFGWYCLFIFSINKKKV